MLGPNRNDLIRFCRAAGVMVRERHQVAAVHGNTLTLVEPLMCNVTAAHGWDVSLDGLTSGWGVEDIHFIGNWDGVDELLLGNGLGGFSVDGSFPGESAGTPALAVGDVANRTAPTSCCSTSWVASAWACAAQPKTQL